MIQENEYNIIKSEYILSDSSDSKKTIVYFQPDLFFMKLCRENNYMLLCFLHNTVYDKISKMNGTGKIIYIRSK